MRRIQMVLLYLGLSPWLTFGGDLYPSVEPEWHKQPLKISLSEYVDYGKEHPQLEFATNDQMICLWWWPSRKTGDYTKEPVEWVVFDVQGKMLASSSNSWETTSPLLRHFPGIAWRLFQQNFVKDAIGCGFSPELSYGLRVLPSKTGPPSAELWDLHPPPKSIWTAVLPPAALSHIRFAGLIPAEGPPAALVDLNGQEAVLLDGATGHQVDVFSYGHIESDKEAVIRKRKFRLATTDGDPSLRFDVLSFSLDPVHGHLACGSLSDRRVRVVTTGREHRTVFEANTDDHPQKPRGGSWRVNRVQFLAGGLYLLAEYRFGGRGTGEVLEPTDIFSTETWSRVWQENTPSVRSVTLSCDGKKMAYLRESVIELGEFSPAGPRAK